MVPQEPELVSEFQTATSANLEQKWPRARIIVLASLLIFVVPLILLHVFFARATIQVWPQITKLHVEERIFAQVGFDKMNLEKKIVRARIFEEEEEQTLLFFLNRDKIQGNKSTRHDSNI